MSRNAHVHPIMAGILEAFTVGAVTEEARSHDDVLDEGELEVAPRFTPEDLDIEDYRWSRGDHRSQRDIEAYESGHSAKDFV